VALPEGELKVNSSQGGGSKDTWVLARGHADKPEEQDEAAQRLAMALPAAPPELVPAAGRQSGPDQ
jgi:hypothetical protein